MDIIYTNNADLVTDDALAYLFDSVGFGSADKYLTVQNFSRRAFPSGVYGFFAFNKPDNRLVGMARVMSDDLICSWISELVVAPDFQRRGIGTTILNNVLERFGHIATYVMPFPSSVSLFTRAGIKPKSVLISCSRAGKPIRKSEPEYFIH